MNPDSFFREVLESHQFRSSDSTDVDFSVSEGIFTESDTENKQLPKHIFLCPIM